ncbi:MAG TPA: glycosyltransferase N-terminal domain-containing protein [Caulobacteraceae bacterium]|nr:glycosyltransferase N-terminal domain-containing protein [Caulobacteraceae bacterium]
MSPAATSARPLSLTAYRIAAGLAAPLARPLLEARARRGKEDFERLGERLGYASAPRPAGALVWLHAVSVGESVSLLPLIDAIAAERPDLALLVTSGTRASARVLAERLPSSAAHQYAPVDTPGAVARFLAHWRPDVGIFVESELWPNLILGARAQGARLALVSARMKERSARRWSARPSAVKAMLQAFELVLPQDAATAARLARFGANVSSRLNLKRLGAPLTCDPAELARLRAAIGARPRLVAVSTHAPEETWLAAAADRIDPRPLLIIAPRHPDRADEIAAKLAPRRLARRSRGEPIETDTDVYLADSFGELGLVLRLGPFAFIGGGFDPNLGGHNPLEAARLGVGLVSGAQVANHAESFAELAAAGAVRLVADERRLGVELAALLADPARAEAMAAAARAYADGQHDQMDRALALMRPLLPGPAG